MVHIGSYQRMRHNPFRHFQRKGVRRSASLLERIVELPEEILKDRQALWCGRQAADVQGPMKQLTHLALDISRWVMPYREG